jgi:hypothetical protein
MKLSVMQSVLENPSLWFDKVNELVSEPKPCPVLRVPSASPTMNNTARNKSKRIMRGTLTERLHMVDSPITFACMKGLLYCSSC